MITPPTPTTEHNNNNNFNLLNNTDNNNEYGKTEGREQENEAAEEYEGDESEEEPETEIWRANAYNNENNENEKNIFFCEDDDEEDNKLEEDEDFDFDNNNNNNDENNFDFDDDEITDDDVEDTVMCGVVPKKNMDELRLMIAHNLDSTLNLHAMTYRRLINWGETKLGVLFDTGANISLTSEKTLELLRKNNIPFILSNKQKTFTAVNGNSVTTKGSITTDKLVYNDILIPPVELHVMPTLDYDVLLSCNITLFVLFPEVYQQLVTEIAEQVWKEYGAEVTEERVLEVMKRWKGEIWVERFDELKRQHMAEGKSIDNTSTRTQQFYDVIEDDGVDKSLLNLLQCRMASTTTSPDGEPTLASSEVVGKPPDIDAFTEGKSNAETVKIPEEIQKKLDYNALLPATSKIKNESMFFEVDPNIPRQFPHYTPAAHYDKHLQEYYAQLEENDVVERVSDNSYVSPITVVSQTDKLRICVDMRKLNEHVPNYSNYIPRIMDIVRKMGNNKFFSEFDLTSAYNQVELHPDVRKYCRVRVGNTVYQYKRVVFGHKYAPTFFQSMMQRLMSGIDVLVYLDNIVVCGQTVEESWEKIGKFLDRANECGLRLNISKTQFLRERIDVLGYSVRSDGYNNQEKKVEALSKFDVAKIKTRADVLKLVGIYNFLKHTVPHMSTLMAPISEFTSSKYHGKRIKPGPEFYKAVENVRDAICKNIKMNFIRDGERPVVMTDASDVGLAGVLGVYRDGVFVPVSLWSRTLQKYERNWSANKKELAAVFYSLCNWFIDLYGRPFTLLVDHQALVHKDTLLPHEVMFFRWYQILSYLTFEIKHIPGSENYLSDFLSRYLPTGGGDSPSDAEAQDNDSDSTQDTNTTDTTPSVNTVTEVTECFLDDFPDLVFLADTQHHISHTTTPSTTDTVAYASDVGVAFLADTLDYDHVFNSITDTNTNTSTNTNTFLNMDTSTPTSTNTLTNPSNSTSTDTDRQPVLPASNQPTTHITSTNTSDPAPPPNFRTDTSADDPTSTTTDTDTSTTVDQPNTPHTKKHRVTIQETSRQQRDTLNPVTLPAPPDPDRAPALTLTDILNNKKKSRMVKFGDPLPLPDEPPREDCYEVGEIVDGEMRITHSETLQPGQSLTSKAKYATLYWTHHDNKHIGAESMVNHLRFTRELSWTGILEEARAITDSCVLCVTCNHHIRNYTFPQIQVALEPLELVQIDLAEMTEVDGLNTILMVVDVNTRHCYAEALPDKSMIEVVHALLLYISRFGNPKTIISDQGTEFVNNLMRVLAHEFKIRYNLSVAYNTSSHAIVERSIGRLREVLRRITNECEVGWPQALPHAVIVVNNLVHRTTKLPPFYAMFYRRHRTSPRSAPYFGSVKAMDWIDYVKKISAPLREALIKQHLKVRTQKEMVASKGKYIGPLKKGLYAYYRNLRPHDKLSRVQYGPTKINRVDQYGNAYLVTPHGVELATPYPASQLFLAKAIPRYESKISALVAHRMSDRGIKMFQARYQNFDGQADKWLRESEVKDTEAYKRYCKDTSI